MSNEQTHMQIMDSPDRTNHYEARNANWSKFDAPLKELQTMARNWRGIESKEWNNGIDVEFLDSIVAKIRKSVSWNILYRKVSLWKANRRRDH